MNTYRRFGKRVFDLLLLALLAPLALPLTALVCCGVLRWLGTPVLFRQTRIGLGERHFSLHKFRTMHPPPKGDYRAVSDAQRLSHFGAWLRSTSLDELPQLWNVLRGDLSFVGPRPLLDFYLPRYTPEQRRRHLVPAGITGWAQVHGRNALKWEDKFRHDLWYVQNQSLWLDIKILFLTIRPALTSHNVTEPGEVSCREFLGSSSNERL